jgi:hypothetical protein
MPTHTQINWLARQARQESLTRQNFGRPYLRRYGLACRTDVLAEGWTMKCY